MSEGVLSAAGMRPGFGSREKALIDNILKSLDALDAFILEADALADIEHAGFLELLKRTAVDIELLFAHSGRKRLLGPPAVPPQVPAEATAFWDTVFSPEYMLQEKAFMEFISGRPYTTESEGYAIDVDAHLRQYPRILYADFIGYQRNIFELLSLLQPEPGASLFEFGFGFGNLLEAFGHAGCVVSGVDACPGFRDLTAARCRMQNVRVGELLCATFAEAAAMPETYDLIAFEAAFHHCLDPLRLLRDIRRKINPGGRLILFNEPVSPAFPLPWGIVRNDGESMYQIRKRGWFEAGFRTDCFEELLRRSAWRLTPLPRPTYVNVHLAEPV